MGPRHTRRHSRRFAVHHTHPPFLIRHRLILFFFLLIVVPLVTVIFPILTAQSPEVFVGTPSKTISIQPDRNGFGPLTMDIGLTISNAPTASDVQDITANFPRPNIYIKINNPNSATLNTSFRQLYEKGYNFYFSLPQDGSAATFLTTFYSFFPSKPVVVEIRTGDNTSKAFMQQLKTNFPLIKINVQPGTDWDIERAWEVYTKAQLRAPVLDSFAWGRFKRPESQPGLDWVFTEVNAWFDIFYDGGIDLNTDPDVGGDGHINYPQNSSTAFSDFRINTPDLKQNYSFLTGILSGAMVNSVQMQNDTSPRYSAPFHAVIYGDTNIPPGSPGKPILRYVADFTEQHPMIIWPLAAKGNGDPWDNQILPQSNSDPLVGVIGKIASGYYIIMTNTSASQTVAAKFPTGVDLTQYQFYSSQRGTGNFASGATQIIFDPLEVIIAAPTLGGAPPVPSSSPASPTPVAPSPTLAPGQPSLTPGPSATPAPPGPSATPGGPVPSPTSGAFFSQNFKIIGRVQTGTPGSSGPNWQSGNYCGNTFPIQGAPKPLNINGYEIGKYQTFSLCNPAPYYLYTFYAPGNYDADGPVTITLSNVPEGYHCTGWSWNSGQGMRSGTGCSLTQDFRYVPPYSGAGAVPGNHHITFFISGSGPSGSPVGPTDGPPPSPTLTPRAYRSPTPIVRVVPVTIPVMGVKLGQFNQTPIQSFSSWLAVLVKVILPPQPLPSPGPSRTPTPIREPSATPVVSLMPTYSFPTNSPTPLPGLPSRTPTPGTGVPLPPSKTPTQPPAPPASPTPTITYVAACPTSSSSTYDTLTEWLPSYPSGDPAVNTHPDLNLTYRGYRSTTTPLRLQDITGATAPGTPPQLGTMFHPTRPAEFVRAYQIYDWNWSTHAKGNAVQNPAATLIGMAAAPGQKLYPPFSSYDIGEDKPVATDPYQVFLIYAEQNRITLKYDRKDTAATGFMLHVEDICTDPNLLALYTSRNYNNPAKRNTLIALRTRDSFGTARGNQVIVAIRANGSFMDPRSRKDWWK